MNYIEVCLFKNFFPGQIALLWPFLRLFKFGTEAIWLRGHCLGWYPCSFWVLIGKNYFYLDFWGHWNLSPSSDRTAVRSLFDEDNANSDMNWFFWLTNQINAAFNLIMEITCRVAVDCVHIGSPYIYLMKLISWNLLPWFLCLCFGI